VNILFSNIGRRTYFVEFALDLVNKGYDINIHVSDSTENTAGFYVSDSVKRVLIPRVSDSEEKYLSSLYNYCKNERIDLLIPLMDFELSVIAKNMQIFESINCRILVSNHRTIINTLNKKENTQFCLSNNIQIPDTYFSYNEIPDNKKIIYKKIVGSGSIGMSIYDNKSDLKAFKEDEYMAQLFVEGDEYGIDILNDFNGNYIHSCVKKKIYMRAGETDKAEVVYSGRFDNLARDISRKFRHIGNMDIDFIVTKDDRIIFIDFNPRFGGGYLFTHFAGFNYLEYIINIFYDKDLDIPKKGKTIIGMKGIKFYSNEAK